MSGCAEDALDQERSTEEARVKALASKQKVQQYNAKWKGVHQHIDTSLEQIKTSLEGDDIDSLELIKVKRNQLMEVREYLKESASLVDAIINEEHEQTDQMTDAEATKKTQAVSKIRECEERLAKLQAAIDASTEVAVPATTEAAAAPTTSSAPIGPRFERRPLPSFKSGELRDYPTFKADWAEAVNGYFKPSEE